MAPDRVGPVGAVQQEHRPWSRDRQHVETIEQAELMAGDEVRFGDQIRRVNRSRSEAQVRHRRRAGLLRVVDEVSLRVERCLFADDLDRVLVGADGAVRAQPVEDRAHDLGVLGRKARVVVEAHPRDIVHDADREVVHRALLLQLVQHGLHHGRGELLGREAVTPADHARRCRPTTSCDWPALPESRRPRRDTAARRWRRSPSCGRARRSASWSAGCRRRSRPPRTVDTAAP